MRFTWLADKNEQNILKHGIDFADAIRIFDGITHERLDDRRDYGEDRWVATGFMERHVIVVVYTTEDESTYHIISARKAKPYEQEDFGRYLSGS